MLGRQAISNGANGVTMVRFSSAALQTMLSM